MSKEELDDILTLLDKKTEEVKNNPQKAQELLVKAGVYTSDGHLAEPYSSSIK